VTTRRALMEFFAGIFGLRPRAAVLITIEVSETESFTCSPEGQRRIEFFEKQIDEFAVPRAILSTAIVDIGPRPFCLRIGCALLIVLIFEVALISDTGGEEKRDDPQAAVTNGDLGSPGILVLVEGYPARSRPPGPPCR